MRTITGLAPIIQRLNLLVQFSRVNLKFTMITLLGLTIGLSIMSAATIQIDSFRTDFYYDTLNKYQNDIELNVFMAGNLSNSSSLLDDLEESKSLFNQQIALNKEKIMSPAEFYPFFRYFTSTTVYGRRSNRIYGLSNVTDSLLSECIPGSRLPTNFQEVLVFVHNTSDIHFSLNDIINITREYYNAGSINMSLTITGILTHSTVTHKIFQEIFSLEKSKSPMEDYWLITDFDLAVSLAQHIITQVNKSLNVTAFLSSTAFLQYQLNSSILTRSNSIDIYNRLLSLYYWTNEYREEYPRTTIYYYGIWKLRDDQLRFEGLYWGFFVQSLPVFVIVGALVNFSLGLINERRKQTLGLLKIRNVTNRFIFLLMFLETLIVAGCSAFLALILGIPLALVLGSSNGLLVFGRSIFPSKLTLNPSHMVVIAITSVVLTVVFHLPSITRFSRADSLLRTEEVLKRRRGKIPIIFGKLEEIFLVLGLIGIAVFSYLRTLGIAAFQLQFFSIYLLFSSVFLFLIGFVFSFNRLLPKIIHLLGNGFWKRDWRLLGIATRNLEMNTQLTSRTTLLIGMSLAFMVMLAIVPISLHNQAVDSAYYTVGGEISINFRLEPGNEHIFDEVLNDFKNVSGFSFTTLKELIIQTYIPQPDGWLSGKATKLLGIESDFAEYSHWRPHYDDSSLEFLVHTLFNSPSNNSAIADFQTLNNDQLSVGDSFSISGAVELSIVELTNLWPRNRWRNIDDDFFVTKASFLENLTLAEVEGLLIEEAPSYTIIGKITNRENRAQIVTEITQVIQQYDDPNINFPYYIGSFTFLDVYDSEALQENNVFTRFQWFYMNTNLVTGLIVVLTTIILFTGTHLSRHTREIALSRALGMKFPQVFTMMFLEPLVLFLLSGITGGIIGGVLTLGMAESLGTYYQVYYQSAPLVLHIDPLVIGGFYLVVFIVSLIAGTLISRKAIRVNISKILKTEYL